MFTAEIALAFLLLLPVFGALGLRPQALAGMPPLNLLARFLGAGTVEFLALTMVFAAFQVALFARKGRRQERVGEHPSQCRTNHP